MNGFQIFMFFITLWLCIVTVSKTNRIERELERQSLATRNLILVHHELQKGDLGLYEEAQLDSKAFVTNLIYRAKEGK